MFNLILSISTGPVFRSRNQPQKFWPGPFCRGRLFFSSHLTQSEFVWTFMIYCLINKNIPAYLLRLPILKILIQIKYFRYKEWVNMHNRNVSREEEGCLWEGDTQWYNDNAEHGLGEEVNTPHEIHTLFHSLLETPEMQQWTQQSIPWGEA